MVASAAQVLGHDRLADEIHIDLIEGRARRLLLAGPSGCGKSWIAERVAQKCEETGFHAIRLTGDKGRHASPYHPLQALRFSTKTKEFISRTYRVVREALTDFQPGVKTVRAALDEAFAAGNRLFGIPRASVGDHVVEAFVDSVRRLSGEEPVLIVLDDIQYFDPDSCLLVDKLLQQFSGNEPDSRQLKLIATRNTDQPVRQEVGDLLRGFFHERQVPLCARNAFEDLLTAFGVTRNLNRHNLDLLFDCCGGHLEVVRAVAEDLENGSALGGRTTDELFRTAMTRRLDSALSGDGQLLSLLAVVAVAGTQIRREEVACLADLTPERVGDILSRGKALSIVDAETSSLRFRHEITWRYFLDRLGPSEREAHARYARCLSRIRPSAYRVRYEHLLAADRHDDAAVAGAQALLQEARIHGTDTLRLTEIGTAWWHESGDLAAALREMLAATAEIRAHHLNQAVVRLDGLSDALPDQLLGERDVLLSTALVKKLDGRSLVRAAEVLSHWDDALIDDLDLWARQKNALVLAFVQLGRFDQARQIRRDLFRRLAPSAPLDLGVARQLRRWELNANMLLEAEAANRQISRACDAMLTMADQGAVIAPSDIFVALTNLSASELVLGRYTRACSLAGQGIQLTRQKLVANWASAAPIYSNLIVASLLAGQLTADECLRELQQLLDRSGEDDDRLLIAANCAAAALYAGDLPAVERALSWALALMEQMDGCEPYVRYFINANHAVLVALQGSRSRAAELMTSIEPLIVSFPPGDRPAVGRRHALVTGALEKTVTSLKQIEEYLMSHDARGPGPNWALFGRAPLFTAIELWADV